MPQCHAQYGNRRDAGVPQPLERQVEPACVSLSGCVARLFDSRLRLVAHDRADIVQRHARLAMRVEGKLFDLAARSATIRAEMRNGLVENVRRDGDRLALQRAPQEIRYGVARIDLRGNRRGV